jgi:hypothetical protein
VEAADLVLQFVSFFAFVFSTRCTRRCMRSPRCVEADLTGEPAVRFRVGDPLFPTVRRRWQQRDSRVTC